VRVIVLQTGMLLPLTQAFVNIPLNYYK